MEPLERLELTVRDLDRLRIINQVLEGRLLQTLAAQQLDLTPRQVRRLCARIKAKGPKGVVHGLRGRRSNHQLKAGLIERALALVKASYGDFGPTFACEKLAERDGLVLVAQKRWPLHPAKSPSLTGDRKQPCAPRSLHRGRGGGRATVPWVSVRTRP